MSLRRRVASNHVAPKRSRLPDFECATGFVLNSGVVPDEDIMWLPMMFASGAPGFGIRGYLNRYFSARFDFRTMVLYSAGEIHVPLELTLTFAVTTRSDI